MSWGVHWEGDTLVCDQWGAPELPALAGARATTDDRVTALEHELRALRAKLAARELAATF
jgi:hypothetical protein